MSKLTLAHANTIISKAFEKAAEMTIKPPGVVVLDDSGAVQFVNSEASRILEVSDQNMPGQILVDVLGPDHPVSEILARVRSTGRASMHDDVEFQHRFSDPLPVDGAAGAVGKGGVLVAEHPQQLVARHQKNAGVAVELAGPLRIVGGV